MTSVKVAKMSDVLGNHNYVEILCPMKGTIARKLTRNGDSIHLDALTEAIDIPAETPLAYEAWFMDRGSILFNGNLKLCTEMDIASYPDGSEAVIEPDASIVPVPEPVDYDAEPVIDDSPTGSEMVCSFDDDTVVPNPR